MAASSRWAPPSRLGESAVSRAPGETPRIPRNPRSCPCWGALEPPARHLLVGVLAGPPDPKLADYPVPHGGQRLAEGCAGPVFLAASPDVLQKAVARGEPEEEVRCDGTFLPLFPPGRAECRPGADSWSASA